MNERIDSLVASFAGQPGPLLVVLHAIQEEFGCIPADAVPRIAEGLNLSRAEVHGVMTFYHHFRTAPPGRHTLRICRAESCQAMNGVALEQHAQRSLAVDYHQTSADGAVTLEPVYCLGACACSPAVILDGELHGRVTPARLDELLAQCRKPQGQERT
jgi:formate dehydrogenase subunit gamma